MIGLKDKNPQAMMPRAKGDLTISIGVTAVLLFFMISTFFSYQHIRNIADNYRDVRHSQETLHTLTIILSLMKDAETGQRGYLITGDDSYLEPYRHALRDLGMHLDHFDTLAAGSQELTNVSRRVKDRIDARLTKLRDNIEVRRNEGLEAAVIATKNNQGKELMDALRAEVAALDARQTERHEQQIMAAQISYRTALQNSLAVGVVGLLLSIVLGAFMRRAANQRRRQEWLQTGQLGLSRALFGEQTARMIGENVLNFLASYFDAKAGVFYVREATHFSKVAVFGVPSDAPIPMQFEMGDGVLGHAARNNQPVFLESVPENYLVLGSAFGRGTPRHLLVATAVSDDHVNAVFELGFLHKPNDAALELLARMSESIGVALRSAQYRDSLQNYLEETQRQSEELQAQGEELRVSNEELEEQSRALQESHARMEEQQAEMEQTNTQLEEQTRLLEQQRDTLTKAQIELEARSRELQKASQYKSEFLANMSHELRTPLNSSLILAKLLSDNPEGNLNEEQVRYAETIQHSGNDLLNLINDILDLSKIEAGHMDVNVEKVRIAKVIADMMRSFEPVARQKNITLSVELTEGCPEIIETDSKRMEQILKNLMSNALKFTERGSVRMDIGCHEDKTITFAVTDTGIGIEPDHHAMIFEAFRQADNTTSRKYGGTGLGLSISRELANLLGGDITLESTPGQGSVFTLSLPLVYAGRSEGDARQPSAEPALLQPPISLKASRTAIPRTFKDDSDSLTAGKSTLLVVEDDPHFAQILYDLCKEIGLQCLLASSAEEAMHVALHYMPNAIILDIGLPDHSGLSVLDRVKQDSRLRHIPVHIISAEDYSQTAYAMGAIGYLLKPVQREELITALRKLEKRLDTRLRRVLIVEDDPVQLDSLKKLIGMQNVETTGESTAAACLERLRTETFDCMVLDLTLPDASGYSLLETLNNEEGYTFPPVIVYTGRDLSAAQEQELRRYSRSIIIKGAKSPERLLDEVTLFLHHVVADMPADKQRMLKKAKSRDATLEGRRIMVVEDDIRNIYSLTSLLEPHGTDIVIARNGREALDILNNAQKNPESAIDLVLMDVMMPVMDGLAATREIRQNPTMRRLPVIMLTAKAMKDDQETCIKAGANDYMAKPLDVEKLLSLIRVWMPR